MSGCASDSTARVVPEHLLLRGVSVLAMSWAELLNRDRSLFARTAKHAAELVAAGVSVNDVVLCISAEALRDYLLDRDELPEQSLTAGVPVSVRDDESYGNAISFIIAKLHTEIADPLERLKAINRSTTLAKDRFKDLPSRLTQETFGSLVMAPYIGQVALNLAGRSTPVYNIVISNVPGPREFLYLNGARMEVFYPISMVFDGQVLNITFLSYAGRYAAWFTAGRDAVPSMQRIAVGTGAALDELEGLIDTGAGSRKVTP